MVTRYGHDVVVSAIALTIVSSLLIGFLVDNRGLRFSLLGILLLILGFTLFFFRDPERKIPPGNDLIISPADGKVVQIKDIEEQEYLGAKGVQVSIFMSPLNVHVNRYPLSGKITYFKHIPGEFLVAFDDKSSTRNERTSIGIESGQVRVLMKQIAGFIARRIVAPVKLGDATVAGERFGMIRFGSRVDVIVPEGSHLKVKTGDKVVAGETVLAVVA